MTTTPRATAQTRALTAPRATRRDARRPFQSNALTLLAVAIFLFLYLPILILVIYSFNQNQVVGVWTGFSTRSMARTSCAQRLVSAVSCLRPAGVSR